MKKILLACLLTVAMVLTLVPVTVHAEAQEGLMSTWYQAINEETEEVRVDHGNAIGGIMGDGTDFDDLLDPDYTVEVGKVLVPSFEIAGAGRPGFDLSAVGQGEGMETMGQDGGTDINDVFIVFEGTITAPKTASYEFSSTYVDNACVIIINDTEVFSFWEPGAWRDADDAEVVEGTEAIQMEAGVAYPITVYYVEQGGGSVLSMDVSVDGADKVQMNTLGFKFAYDPDAVATPEPTEEPTPTPEATEAPTATPEATEEAPATTAPATKAPSTSAPATSAPATSTDAGDADVNDETAPDNTLLIIIIAVVAVAAVAAVVVIVVKKKKK